MLSFYSSFINQSCSLASMTLSILTCLFKCICTLISLSLNFFKTIFSNISLKVIIPTHFLCSSLFITIAKLIFLFFKISIQSNRLYSVSYTHLDVYKRQSHVHAPGRCYQESILLMLGFPWISYTGVKFYLLALFCRDRRGQ